MHKHNTITRNIADADTPTRKHPLCGLDIARKVAETTTAVGTCVDYAANVVAAAAAVTLAVATTIVSVGPVAINVAAINVVARTTVVRHVVVAESDVASLWQGAVLMTRVGLPIACTTTWRAVSKNVVDALKKTCAILISVQPVVIADIGILEWVAIIVGTMVHH